MCVHAVEGMRPKLAPNMVMKLVILLLILTLMITSAAAKGGGGGGHGGGGHGESGGHEGGGADQAGSGSHQDGNGDIAGKPKIIPVHGYSRPHNGHNDASNLSDSWFHSMLFLSLSSFFLWYICFI